MPASVRAGICLSHPHSLTCWSSARLRVVTGLLSDGQMLEADPLTWREGGSQSLEDVLSTSEKLTYENGVNLMTSSM